MCWMFPLLINARWHVPAIDVYLTWLKLSAVIPLYACGLAMTFSITCECSLSFNGSKLSVAKERCLIVDAQRLDDTHVLSKG